MESSHIRDMLEFIQKHKESLDQDDLLAQAKLTEISIFLVKLYEIMIGHYTP